uniref:Uncharacterized protein n=1 Tax=Ditylum brightwellii TaxID=49249 RepID=A0A7S2A4V5_9STRA
MIKEMVETQKNDGISSSNVAAKAALADAIAGTAASLVSLLAFYPVDVIKTRTQVGYNHRHPQKSSLETAISLLSGLHYKLAHTTLSSFTYFYLFSYVQSLHKSYDTTVRRHTRGGRGGSGGEENEVLYRPSVKTRLLLAAVAAAVNTLLTLPLDVLASRSQTSQPSEEEEEECKDNENNTNEENKTLKRSLTSIVWDEIERETTWEEEGLIKEDDDTYNTSETYNTAAEDEIGIMDTEEGEEKKECNSLSADETTIRSCTKQRQQQPDPSNHQHIMYTNTNNNNTQGKIYPPSPIKQTATSKINTLQKILSLWSGLRPSLLLCSNPSIHHTVFDALKASLLLHKQSPRQNNSKPPALSMWEAFVIGLISKFVATIVTYPLIRAKVVLMVSSSNSHKKLNKSPQEKSKQQQREEISNTNHDTKKQKASANSQTCQQRLLQSPPSSLPLTQPLTMTAVLLQFLRQDGIKGLYRGCRLQLLSTMLKSALLMMVRERIQNVTRRLILES